MALQARHPMPFGTECLSGGGVHFRLWAPGLRSVAIQLLRPRPNAAAEHRCQQPMHRLDGGWFELEMPEAVAGDQYRVHLPDGMLVPDPASRFQPHDVHGPSEVIDPTAFAWDGDDWDESSSRGRPWHEAIVYELHVGTFSEGGDYAGVEAQLDRLVALGVTAIELMPLADFPGRRNWGYDGALLFAPDSSYGRPNDLKRLVRAAHRRGLMVLLDVVYNHFGPEGNYLHRYAPDFFHRDQHTPWGAAIDFDGPRSAPVRGFFIHNALYWIEEYRLDGLRLDAVDRIDDRSRPDILDELAARILGGPGRERQIHLVLENDRNDARRCARSADGRPTHFTAQWNDDFHHACHALLTGEDDGHYEDFKDRPLEHLGVALAEGFAYQGDASAFRGGQPRGQASGHLPPLAFVNFLQNHDQAGNRAFGERLHQLIPPATMDAALAILLLAPSPPLLFMGQELDGDSPFLFFCDFGPELAEAVRQGRLREFARSEHFADAARRGDIPDPNDPATFERSRVRWDQLRGPSHLRRLALHQRLLAIRRREIVPRLPAIAHGGRWRQIGATGLVVEWTVGDAERLQLLANLGPKPVHLDQPIALGRQLYAHPELDSDAEDLPAWGVCWAILA
jgi:malto-oligosyltrehalose trehalohydrolase